MSLKTKGQEHSERLVEEAGGKERAAGFEEDAYVRRLFPATAILLVIFAIDCASRGEWTGVIGSVLGAVQAMLARHYFHKWTRT